MSSTITSHRNERVKAIKRLVLDAGERRRLGLAVIEGLRVATDHLRSGGAIEEALVSSRINELEGGPALLEALTVHFAASPDRLLRVTDEVLGSVSDTRAPQGVLLCVPRPAHEGLPSSTGRPVLVAWELQDPGNAGSLARTAEAAGCAAMIFAASPSGPLVDAFSPRAVRAAASSSFRLPVHEWRGEPGTLASELRAAGFRVACCVAHDASPPDDVDLSGAVAIVIGAETRGLPSELSGAAELAVTIPLAPGAESLNAAAAAAVIAFEAARQRRMKG